MSRRYVERYDERERDYYDRRPVRGGYDDEYEVDIQQERYERRPSRGVPVVEEIYRSTRQPDFLREGYGRDAAGPLVVRDREDSKGFQRDKARTDISVVGSRRGQSPPAEKITKEEIVIKEKIRDNASEAGRSRRSVVGRPARESEEVLDDRRSEVRRIPREVSRRELVEEEVVIRKSDRERDRGREREHDYSPPPRRKEMVVDDREVVFRRADSRPPARHELDREEIYYRDERSPSRDRSIEREERQDFVVRTRGSDSRRRERGYEEDRIVVESRDRERSRPPPRLRSLGTPIARQGVHDGEEYREKDVIVDREVDKTEIVKEDKQVTRIRSESSRPLRKDDGSRRDSGRPLRRDMWTEVAKDLVSREALVKAGYNFEESTKNFYVMDYLQLVSNSQAYREIVAH
ncbi:hypothetical protein ANO11243_007020 [Dothideomycetidae sp. 11243]|nr:hypothetical protein ANO11243_007020 [fungal sp. No.11243]